MTETTVLQRPVSPAEAGGWNTGASMRVETGGHHVDTQSEADGCYDDEFEGEREDVCEDVRTQAGAARSYNACGEDPCAGSAEEAAEPDGDGEGAGAPELSDSRPAEELTAQELGKRGEDAAVRYLKLNGYEIIERNWRCKFGEADIIARDEEEGVICFIEVKTRRSIEAGVPEEAVTPVKQRRYERIALSYMIGADFDEGARIRFDTIGICVTESRRALLRHHKGCFDGLF